MVFTLLSSFLKFSLKTLISLIYRPSFFLSSQKKYSKRFFRFRGFFVPQHQPNSSKDCLFGKMKIKKLDCHMDINFDHLALLFIILSQERDDFTVSSRKYFHWKRCFYGYFGVLMEIHFILFFFHLNAFLLFINLTKNQKLSRAIKRFFYPWYSSPHLA